MTDTFAAIAGELLKRQPRSPVKRTRCPVTVPALIARLMEQPLTAKKLAKRMTCSESTVKRWIADLAAAGVIVSEPDPDFKGYGTPPRRWRMNTDLLGAFYLQPAPDGKQRSTGN